MHRQHARVLAVKRTPRWRFGAGGRRLLPEPDALFKLYKSVFISRLTSDEAETMEGVLAAADAKLRLMFNSVEYFVVTIYYSPHRLRLLAVCWEQIAPWNC